MLKEHEILQIEAPSPLFTDTELLLQAKSVGTASSLDDLTKLVTLLTVSPDSIDDIFPMQGLSTATVAQLYASHPELFDHLEKGKMRDLLYSVNSHFLAELKTRYRYVSQHNDLLSRQTCANLFAQLDSAHLLDQMIKATSQGFVYQPLQI